MVGVDHARAQLRLGAATVGVVGAGGIGSNVASLLATAGIGHLVLTDGDHVELGNLTRQCLYDESVVGEPKVLAAARRLRLLNSSVEVTPVTEAAHRGLFDDHLAGCDIVVLSADSPDELHEWIDDAARRLGFAYLAAGYIEAVGSVGPLVIPGHTACYECFRRVGELEQHLAPGEQPGPNLNAGMQAGSYGPLNFLVASIAANEVVRCLLGAECASAATRLMITSTSYRVHTEHFNRLDECKACGQVTPSARWEGAVPQVTLEDVYDSDREKDSVNAVLLDDLMERLISVNDGTTALDFGCGSGAQALMLARRGATVSAFDTSRQMLQILDAKTPPELRPRINALSELSALDGLEATFDVIVCNNVLDHVSDLDELVARLRRVAATGAQVIVTVPHPIKDGARWRRTRSGDRWEYDEMVLEQYFNEGPVTKHRENAAGETVIAGITTNHRTVDTYFTTFRKHGFDVTALHEPQPPAGTVVTHPEIWAKTSRLPYFLVFVLRPSPTVWPTQ
jgi:molybdopterin/thiamine biosynthesis adenylyltransferase/ubiquinone/menaquinone biosynthesis C-methylase UbiE